VSTFANDGVYVPPRIVTGTLPPQGGVQTVAFHPAESHRVISPYTAAEMRSMMQKVVLEGTGRKAILEGYSSAGKTGTGQKVDPATGSYSKTKYVGSFAGFAPVNNPQVVVLVILDSAVGPHQGGQVAAPVFKRIAQQVLEYLHVPHDLPLDPKHQLLFARAGAKDKDLEEGTPDHPGEPLETAELDRDVPPPVANTNNGARASSSVSPGSANQPIVQAAIREKMASEPENQPHSAAASNQVDESSVAQAKVPITGTVVLDVEQGGIEVPSFLGKTVRGAVESAQDAGLDLEAVGSGVARQQAPAAGTHVAAGAHVTVQFGR
jgi:cell division protein FtsI (penicillin-binding protein 3)